jgi:hypothetical protein
MNPSAVASSSVESSALCFLNNANRDGLRSAAAADHLFMDLLRVADRRRTGLLLRDLLSPQPHRALIR